MKIKKNITILFLLTLQFVFSQEGWNTDFKQTIDSAKSQNKTVLLVFSGSDWCANCIRLKNEILSKDAFINKIKDQFLIVNADFPRKKKTKEAQSQAIQDQNKKLIENYNQASVFPLVVVIDTSEKSLGKLGYIACTPEEYAEKLKAFLPH